MVYRGSNGTRATWNTDGSKKQIELYGELIKDYDRKNKELIVENNDIKAFLAEVYTNLSKSLSDSSRPQHSPERSETSMNLSKFEEDDCSDVDRCLAEEIVHHPFDNIFAKLSKEFKKKFDHIKDLQSQSGFNFHENNHNSQNNYSTISSISSFSSKTLNTVNDDDILNATFTIEDKKQRDSKHKVNSFFLEKTISSSTSSSSASPPSMSILSDHLEKIQNSTKSNTFLMNKNGKNCSKSSSNGLIEEFNQVKCVQTSEHKEKSFLNDETSITNELNSLAIERKKLAMEKKNFYAQKLKLEDEANSFQHLSADLIKQVSIQSFFGSYFVMCI